MNDKIKELAQGATEWCRENAQGTPVAWEWENKFAELIVRECMEVASKQRNPQALNYKPSERFVEDLKKHFGVEE